MANSADPDQLASSEANWSESTLFAKAEYIWVQQDKDNPFKSGCSQKGMTHSAEPDRTPQKPDCDQGPRCLQIV